MCICLEKPLLLFEKGALHLSGELHVRVSYFNSLLLKVHVRVWLNKKLHISSNIIFKGQNSRNLTVLLIRVLIFLINYCILHVFVFVKTPH